jgi:hypothetical protein
MPVQQKFQVSVRAACDMKLVSIDVFVSEPFPFSEEYVRALIKPLYETLEVRFVSIPTLIRMKEVANRAQDRIDIEHLRMRLTDD